MTPRDRFHSMMHLYFENISEVAAVALAPVAPSVVAAMALPSDVAAVTLSASDVADGDVPVSLAADVAPSDVAAVALEVRRRCRHVRSNERHRGVRSFGRGGTFGLSVGGGSFGRGGRGVGPWGRCGSGVGFGRCGRGVGSSACGRCGCSGRGSVGGCGMRVATSQGGAGRKKKGLKLKTNVCPMCLWGKSVGPEKTKWEDANPCA